MTLKQRLAFKKMVENGGNISKAMREAGYSANTAKTPQKLTRTKAWQELIKNTDLSENDTDDTCKSLLKSSKLSSMIFPVETSDEDIRAVFNEDDYLIKDIIYTRNHKKAYFFMPDNITRVKVLSTLIKAINYHE